MPEAGDEGLSATISRADRAGLLRLVRENLGRLSEVEALRCLRHPFASAELIEEIAGVGIFLAQREVRKAIAVHPASDRSTALRCVEDLPWRDLLDVGRSSRTPLPVRRLANNRVLESYDVLALGEKIAVGRLADRMLLRPLLGRAPVEALRAILLNPRLVEEDLVGWVVAGGPTAVEIETLAGEPGWMSRRALVSAILLSPRTPRAVSLGLLRRGCREDWRRLAGSPGTDPLVAACAVRLLEASGLDRGGADVPNY